MRCINTPNRKAWQAGDLVIHDREAKERRMIRVVVAVLPGGMLRTAYQFPNELPPSWRTVRSFNSRELHDPRRFGLSMSKKKKAA